MRRTFLGLFFAAGYLVQVQPAVAQATSDCYYDANIPNANPGGRMVDAQPLMGTLRSTPETTGTLHYLQYLPTGHDPSKKWPVIVFMHGSGEKDNAPTDESLRNLTKHSLPRVVENPDWDWPFIVISPQTGDGGWLSRAADIGMALDNVVQNFGGDPERIYLTGLSYGGVGTLAVGIALADRVAALLPVTPGGESVDNWDMRASIANKAIWLFNGTDDAQYQTNSTRMMDIETSGGAAFYHYDYAFLDEYNDVVPMQALNELHVFGSYESIGHDVWHATYGVYCPNDPMLITQKTVQYEWLLQQSLDGSAFVDPRDPNGSSGNGGAGGAAGAAAGGAAGAAGTSAAGEGGAGVAAGGVGGSANGAGASNAGAGGSGASAGSSVAGNSSTAGSTAAAGAPSGTGNAAASTVDQDSGGCQLTTRRDRFSGLALLVGLSAWLGLRRKRG